MTAINVEIDNEYFMVKVERLDLEPKAYVVILTPDQQNELYSEVYTFGDHKHCQQFELDFDKRDAKKVARRYLKFR